MRQARYLVEPAIICAIMFALATALAIASGLRGTGILKDYILVGALSAGLATMFWMLLPWVRGPYRNLSPFSALIAMVKERWLLLLLPLLIFPTFMTGFTIAKSAFPVFTGFRWDVFWTEADAMLFGTDPWRVTHALIGVQGSHVLVIFYTLIWAFALSFAVPMYCYSAKPRDVQHAFSALMLTWLTVGVLFAAIFSSVGPTFADVFDAGLAQRFAPFHHSLQQLLPPTDPILITQQYLRGLLDHPHAIRGGGVSAMPSMHLGVCTFLVLLARKSWWRIPALILWAVIWIGSIHFGFHYAWDGIIAAVLTVACWYVTAPAASSQRSTYWPKSFGLSGASTAKAG